MSEPLTPAEATARAMLRSGASYVDASQATRVPVERCMELVPMQKDLIDPSPDGS